MADSTPSKRRGMPRHTVLEFLLHTTTKIGAIFMENTTTDPDVLERFLRYVQINTQSEDANCDQVPSSTVQFDLANVLAEELRELGATDAYVTENAYVCAHIPASAGSENKPALGLIAHLDTTEVAPGAGVAPHIVHYEGGDLVCGIVDGKPVSMSTAKLPALNNLVGEDLVCTDGTTLLGADDKAGVAEIMALVARIAQDPSLPHPALGICFCPDEEIGHGAELLDIEAFGCKYAYTVDGGPVGELEWECFNAAEATVRFEGQSIHPGDAKGRMVNAGNLFCDFNALLPYEQRPEYTEGYEGFYHLEGVSATVDHATARYIVRDHDAAKFQQKLELMNAAAALLNQRLGEERVTVEIKHQYRNMAEKFGPADQLLIDYAVEANREVGIEPVLVPARGGTDGAQLTFRGLPCPNIATGGYNAHSVREFVPVRSLELTVDLLERLVAKFAAVRADGTVATPTAGAADGE